MRIAEDSQSVLPLDLHGIPWVRSFREKVDCDRVFRYLDAALVIEVLRLESRRPKQVDDRGTSARFHPGRQGHIDVGRSNSAALRALGLEHVEGMHPATHEDDLIQVRLEGVDDIGEYISPHDRHNPTRSPRDLIWLWLKPR
jgi:hypothetical protein